MRKQITLLAAIILIIALLTGCATTQPQRNNESKTVQPTSSTTTTSAATESAPALSEYVVPVTGNGTLAKTDVRAKGDYKIVCIAKNATNPYMVSLLEGAKRAGEEVGFEAILMAPANGTIDEQVRIIEDMIQMNVNGIIVHSIDSNGIMPALRKAQEAGIPIVTVGTPVADRTVPLTHTGMDCVQQGYEVAKYVAEAMDGKGEVIILEGIPGAQNSMEKLEGMEKGLAEYPDITIVASQVSNMKRTESMNVTENLLQKHKSVNAILGANDESALGALQAVKAAGRSDILIGGADGNVDCANAIKNGEVLVSYNSDPFGSAYFASVAIIQYLDDGISPDSDFVPYPNNLENSLLLTSDNIDYFIENEAWWKE